MNKKHNPDEYDDGFEYVTSMLGSRFSRLADDDDFDRQLLRGRRARSRLEGYESPDAKRSRKRIRERMH